MRGLGLMIVGVEGIGKTTLSLQFPKPLTCISILEKGYEDLSETGEIPDGCTNIVCEDFNTCVDILRESEDQKTVVIDSTSGFQDIFFRWVAQKSYQGNMKKFNAYSEGPRKMAPPELANFLNTVDKLRAAGTTVIFLAHCKTVKMQNPLGEDYDCYTPDMDEGISSVFKKWAQAILFLNMEVDENRPLETTRIMYTEKSPRHCAKNRMGLPFLISLGDSPEEAYKNFYSKLSSTHQKVLTDG